MAESVHEKLKRVRKPRVHITYDVETEGAVEQKELPFVVGVLGDFSGDPTQELKPMRDRNFVQIDRDNFDDVMQRMPPGLNLRVENTLKDDGSEMPVALQFKSMEDFEPSKVAAQVEPIEQAAGNPGEAQGTPHQGRPLAGLRRSPATDPRKHREPRAGCR